uniref:Uncharacterized protein n=1 Tax=Arundo donax TaxID=35708 RepID=A0A0A9AKB5_ARUDO
MHILLISNHFFSITISSSL